MPKKPRGWISQGLKWLNMAIAPIRMSRTAMVMPGTGERGPTGGRSRRVAGASAPAGGPAGMRSHSSR
jgi:hypothetical protein